MNEAMSYRRVYGDYGLTSYDNITTLTIQTQPRTNTDNTDMYPTTYSLYAGNVVPTLKKNII